ncbi:MAG TPA: hypothetical protein VIK04_08385 [Solirubrobacteraceae bacterium]
MRTAVRPLRQSRRSHGRAHVAVLVELIHAAARQVSAGAMDTASAQAALLRTADAVVARRPARAGPAPA